MSVLKVLALDPATHMGFAHSCGASGVWDLSVRKDESSGMRLIRLISKLDSIMEDVGVNLLVYEAVRNARPGMQRALICQSEIQGQIKVWCERLHVEYRGYSPSEVKKHATGKGNAGKEMMIEAARKRWPDKELSDDNECDALWILDLALSEYGKREKKS